MGDLRLISVINDLSQPFIRSIDANGMNKFDLIKNFDEVKGQSEVNDIERLKGAGGIQDIGYLWNLGLIKEIKCDIDFELTDKIDSVIISEGVVNLKYASNIDEGIEADDYVEYGHLRSLGLIKDLDDLDSPNSL